MFKGKAELRDPENNWPIATFTEICKGDGEAHMRVVFHSPVTLRGTERLAIYSTVKDEEIISVTAARGHSIKLHEFEGTSSLGCLGDKSDISLTQSPGGTLDTLLFVLGKGTIHRQGNQ